MSKHNKAVNSPMGQPISPQRQNPIYPKPTVPVALGEFLSPKQVTAAGLEVVVTYPSIKPGDMIALKFNGEDTFVPIEVKNQTSVSFWVSVPHIIKALGTTVDIQYALSGESAGQESDILQLKVLPLMEEDMTIIKIPQATESTPGKLDLSTFTGDAEFIIPPWPLIAEKQLVWMDMDSGSSTQHLLKEYSVTSDDVPAGVTGSISRAILENILVTTPEGALLEFAARVQLDGSDSPTTPINFPTTPINFPILELQLLYHGGGSGSGSEDFEGEDVPIGEFASIFETADLTFKGGAASDVTLHHKIITHAGSTAISLQTSRDPAAIIFKNESKPSYVSMNISLIGAYNSCAVICLGSEESKPMILSPESSQNITLYGTDITKITFTRLLLRSSTASFLTVILDNIKWGKVDKGSD